MRVSIHIDIDEQFSMALYHPEEIATYLSRSNNNKYASTEEICSLCLAAVLFVCVTVYSVYLTFSQYER